MPLLAVTVTVSIVLDNDAICTFCAFAAATLSARKNNIASETDTSARTFALPTRMRDPRPFGHAIMRGRAAAPPDPRSPPH